MRKSRMTILLLLFTSLLCLTPPEAIAKEVDTTDNKYPVLVSITLDKHLYTEGELVSVTVVIRDDKNEIQGVPYVLFGSPADSPGNISGGVFAQDGKGLIESKINDSYIEQTFLVTFNAPSWAGDYYGFDIQQVRDKNGNQVGYDLRKCSNKNIYTNPQAPAFPNITPICDVNFSVKLLSAEQKAQKAAADKAAADKAAADKAVADKVASEKVEIRVLLDSIAGQISSLKLNYGYTNTRVQQVTLDRLNQAFAIVEYSGYSEIRLLAQKVQLELMALEQTFAKEKKALKKSTITCVKGKVIKKVTAVSPKCPVGYKKK